MKWDVDDVNGRKTNANEFMTFAVVITSFK